MLISTALLLLPREVAGPTARVYGVLVRIHSDILLALGLPIFVVAEAVIIRDCLEHIEPNGALLALKVTWLEFYSAE